MAPAILLGMHAVVAVGFGPQVREYVASTDVKFGSQMTDPAFERRISIMS